MGVITWSPLPGGWLSGKWRKDADDLEPMAETRKRLTDRYDLSLPSGQRKLEAAETLAKLAEEAGLTLIEMAIAFVINRYRFAVAPPSPLPATVLGNVEQLESQLTAAEIELSDDVLDRVDEIVTPGTNINPARSGNSRVRRLGPASDRKPALPQIA